MLPLKNRLTKREDFAAVYSKGLYTALDGITIKYLRSTNPAVRLGFPVGKNFSKKSVDRNRARRVLRAAAHGFLTELKPGTDIVIMVKPGKVAIDFQKIESCLKNIFSRANLLK